MNDIYWHEKRTMSSKQLSSPPPTQPRRSYENTLRANRYEQMNVRYDTNSRTGRTAPSPYHNYQTVSSRPYYHNNSNFPYATSSQGTYRHTQSSIMTPPPPPTSALNSRQNRQIDPRSSSEYSQHRYISRSVGDDYFLSKYDDINRLSDEIYGDEDADEYDNEENHSEVFNYPYGVSDVSFIKEKIVKCSHEYNSNCFFFIHFFIDLFCSIRHRYESLLRCYRVFSSTFKKNCMLIKKKIYVILARFVAEKGIILFSY